MTHHRFAELRVNANGRESARDGQAPRAIVAHVAQARGTLAIASRFVTEPYSCPLLSIRGWRFGFTLIELLLVISIIGILASLLLPALGAAKRKAQSVHCLSNLRQIGISVRLYADENEGRLPVALAFREDQTNTSSRIPAIQEVLATHVGGASNLFRCPADPDGVFARQASSYEWNVSVNGRLLHRIGQAPGDPSASAVFLLRDREGWHAQRRRSAVFADGHVGPAPR